ncbi:High-affinity choline uptake protein BetT [Furfurilactobacillus rossiae]|nr:High-affinity choline uptake protein BetT [Furfurilactobacillus rossiae]QLE68335.1 High-affinity choline uptake protein BetT [Furfurilactobacillus rossiae]
MVGNCHTAISRSQVLKVPAHAHPKLRRIIILKRQNVDRAVFVPTMILFGIVSLMLIIGGSAVQQTMNAVLSFLTTKTEWLYVLIYVINFIFFMALVMSKYGRIKLGKPGVKADYNGFQWGSMVFATGIDASILMLSATDPLQYLQHPAFGAKPFSSAAYVYANVVGEFNWGPMAWMIFATATIAIAYTMHVKGKHVQRLSAAIPLLQGPGRTRHVLRQLIDFLVVFGIMGGIGSSIGMEIPVIAKVLSTITGVPDNIYLKLALFVVLFILFALTVYAGLNKGIKKLSAWHIYLAIGFLIIVLLVGPTMKLIGGEGQTLALMVQHFTAMSFNKANPGVNSFAQHQTMFYWGWWLSYMPVMGLFIARISRGKTIRQVIVGMLTYGVGGCLSFYAVLGGYALWLQQTGTVNLVHILNTQGQASVLAALIQTLPMKMVMLVMFCLSCFVFLATTISSSAFIVSSFTSLKLSGTEQPTRWNRMAWVIIFIVFSLGIVLVGGFETVQAICTIAGFPLIFVALLLLHSIYQSVMTDPSVQRANLVAPANERREWMRQRLSEQ